MSEKITKTFLADLYGAPFDPYGLLQAYPVEDRVYKNVLINLDGYTFKNCAFIQCDLVTAKGNFHIIDCHVSGCRVSFSGNAARIVKLSSLLLDTFQGLEESLHATLEADGGFSI